MHRFIMKRRMTMNLLLDTHTLLWFLEEDPRLSQETLDALQRAAVVYISAVSIWEIAIKQAKGHLRMPPGYMEYIRQAGFTELPLHFAHADALKALPPIHKDPFDRMLIAQARYESLTIVTRDAHMLNYPVKTLKA